MIGINSIVYVLKITNQKRPKYYYKVLVQANRNYGIYDIVIPTEYLPKELEVNTIRSRVLNVVKGCQINDPRIYERVNNLLSFELNNVK